MHSQKQPTLRNHNNLSLKCISEVPIQWRNEATKQSKAKEVMLQFDKKWNKKVKNKKMRQENETRKIKKKIKQENEPHNVLWMVFCGRDVPSIQWIPSSAVVWLFTRILPHQIVHLLPLFLTTGWPLQNHDNESPGAIAELDRWNTKIQNR